MRIDSPHVKVAAGAVVGVATILAIKKAVSPVKQGNENQRPQIAAANESKEVPYTLLYTSLDTFNNNAFPRARFMPPIGPAHFTA